MMYQLPNGKVINLSVEEYLDLTDNDIQYLMGMNAGEYAYSPFKGSVIKNHKKQTDNEIKEDKSIDYIPESDEPFDGHNNDSFEEEEEEYPDFPDDMSSII